MESTANRFTGTSGHKNVDQLHPLLNTKAEGLHWRQSSTTWQINSKHRFWWSLSTGNVNSVPPSRTHAPRYTDLTQLHSLGTRHTRTISKTKGSSLALNRWRSLQPVPQLCLHTAFHKRWALPILNTLPGSEPASPYLSTAQRGAAWSDSVVVEH